MSWAPQLKGLKQGEWLNNLKVFHTRLCVFSSIEVCTICTPADLKVTRSCSDVLYLQLTVLTFSCLCLLFIQLLRHKIFFSM